MLILQHRVSLGHPTDAPPWKCSQCLLCLSALSPGEEVLKLLHTCSPVNLEELKKQESQLPREDSEYNSVCIDLQEMYKLVAL